MRMRSVGKQGSRHRFTINVNIVDVAAQRSRPRWITTFTVFVTHQAQVRETREETKRVLNGRAGAGHFTAA